MSNRFHKTERAAANGRFFAPDSAIWRVDREMALLFGGGRALLMQLAHPKIAAGVAHHSDFMRDPLGRLARTMATMWSIVFDDLPRAQASLARLDAAHRQVRGAVEQPDVAPADARYSAGDPELRLWVHATLVDSALATYERFVAPLSAEEARAYYAETKKLGVLLGVPAAALPDSLAAFQQYVEATIESDAIAVGATARALARAVLSPRPWLLKTFAPLNVLITAGLLPSKLRHAYGLRWNRRRERAFGLVARSTRAVLPLVPSFVRVVPHARAAESGARRFAARLKEKETHG